MIWRIETDVRFVKVAMKREDLLSKMVICLLMGVQSMVPGQQLVWLEGEEVVHGGDDCRGNHFPHRLQYPSFQVDFNILLN